jgi:hypothetical protein
VLGLPVAALFVHDASGPDLIELFAHARRLPLNQVTLGKQDFRYVAEEDAYICPAGQRLAYHYTTEENGLVLRRYWTNACQSCAIKHRCTTAKERRITRSTRLHHAGIGSRLYWRG